MARRRVLITGFGPFPGVSENPSAWLAETLAQQAPPECEGELHARILPTEWQAAALMPQLYASLQPQVMIHFGLSQRATSLRVERTAHNHAARRADASGALPTCTAIRADGPERFETAVPVPVLAAHLRRSGVPAATSRSAGRYLCNFLYYHSLGWASRNDCLAVFVHLPPLNGNGPFSELALVHGAREILRFVLDLAQSHAADRTVTGPAFTLTEAVMSAKNA
jgi:pyroglutamyl-peptidase